MIRVSKGALQNWEQGRRHPRGPAQTLLRVFEKDPEAVVPASQQVKNRLNAQA
jgi:putative transcriptional regulator